MSKKIRRAIVEIGEGRCIGCGLCLPDCPAGALEIPDGTSRLTDDRCCDGCGTCVDACPERAIRIVEREARPFDVKRLMERITLRGEAAVKGYLEYLAGRGETALYNQAIECLIENRITVPVCRRAEPLADEADRGAGTGGVAGHRVPDAGNGDDDPVKGTVSEAGQVRSG